MKFTLVLLLAILVFTANATQKPEPEGEIKAKTDNIFQKSMENKYENAKEIYKNHLPN
jgi:hypothetical protein